MRGLSPLALLVWLLGCGPSAGPSADELRVISLSPALTRIVLALDAGESIVGVDRYSQRLEGVGDRASLGGLFAPDLERTIELRPNLVLAVESAQQESFLSQLRARGVRVETFAGHTLDEVLVSFERVGELVGRAKRGRSLALDVRTALDTLRRERAGAPVSMAVVVELEPLYVVGGGSFVNELVTAAGGANVFGDLEQPYPRVSLEVLAERAPELLLDTTFDETRMATAQDDARAYWSRFSWVRRVEVLPQGILTLPGPDLAEAALLLHERISP